MHRFVPEEIYGKEGYPSLKKVKEWRKRFLNNRDRAKKIYDEKFCKMWDYYLAASQSSFEYAGSVVFQIQLAKTNSPVPQTRDYIYK